MTDGSTQTETVDGSNFSEYAKAFSDEVMALVIVWCATDADRIGEVALLPKSGASRILGRGSAQAGESHPRLSFFRQRPGINDPCGPLNNPGVSRQQILLSASAKKIRYEKTGKCGCFHNGQEKDKSELQAGDVLTLKNQLVLLCVSRPSVMGLLTDFPKNNLHSFGEADEFGLVGESPQAWNLRDKVAFNSARSSHVLILGESGSGKELVAAAIHKLSARSINPMISRNAATIPSGLMTAEFFGNIKDYPNPGMKERKGLIGEAHGSTLFLDEIGEVSEELQASLLRVLDSGGEYHRLGESTARRVDIRLAAATNRDKDELKHDFLARLQLRINVPRLDERREDIPLIIRHLLQQTAAKDPMLGDRFLENGQARIDPTLVEALVRHQYTHNVRELGGYLIRAMADSPGDIIWLTDEVKSELSVPESSFIDPASLTAEQIQACLDEHDGNQSKAYQALGLKNRDALYRLIKKHGLVVTK